MIATTKGGETMKENIRKALDALAKALEDDEVEDEKSLDEVVEDNKEESKEVIEEGTEEKAESNIEEVKADNAEVVRTETRVEKIDKTTGNGSIETKITFKDGAYYGI